MIKYYKENIINSKSCCLSHRFSLWFCLLLLNFSSNKQFLYHSNNWLSFSLFLFSLFPPFFPFCMFFPPFPHLFPSFPHLPHFPPPPPFSLPCPAMSYSFLFHLTSIQTICSGEKVFYFLSAPPLQPSFPMNSFYFPLQFKIRTVCLHVFSSLVFFIVLGFILCLPILVCQCHCLSTLQR